MQRLDKDAARWVEVATTNLPSWPSAPADRPIGRVLHGYAVVGHIILLSLQPSAFFFTFDCSTCAWAPVVTTKAKKHRYIAIHERGVYSYVQEDDTIYFLSGTVVYAYKLCQYQGGYRMAPPTMVTVFALSPKKAMGSSGISAAGSCAPSGPAWRFAAVVIPDTYSSLFLKLSVTKWQASMGTSSLTAS
jgi:hypothetical protein